MQFISEAKALGFLDGDILVGTDIRKFKNFDTRDGISETYRDLSKAKYVDVLRSGKPVRLTMPTEGLNMLQMFKSTPPFVLAYFPAVIDSVITDMPAGRAGVRVGDRIVAINSQPVTTWNDYNAAVAKMSDKLVGAPTDDSLAMRHITLTVFHEGSATADTLSMMMNESLQIGVIQRGMRQCYQTVTQSYGILESIPAGISHGWNVLKGYLGDFKYIFTKEGATSVGSFGAIGSMFPSVWDWHRFWELTAFISIILAFMNILPIPALDGGHVLFLLAEIILRRKPSDKLMERAEMVGITLLILLMVFAIRNDIVNFLL